MDSKSVPIIRSHELSLNRLVNGIDCASSDSVVYCDPLLPNPNVDPLSMEPISPHVEVMNHVSHYRSSTIIKKKSANAIPQYACTVTNVKFSYGRGKRTTNALNNITIKVPVGSIYGILGPSGCGKSTLVHCLVGSLKPRRGIVKVFGEVPGSHRALVPGPGVGYMPQEIGLFNEFTIQETLFFFGRLYRLPSDTINGRIAFLISFLELPDKSAMVGRLSGGQARRVSLAAALVHKPPLLVLDEPTVGIDPVLRQSIWSHLRSLTDDHGITVIITTHYIEEARLANLVAFMRHGTLMEEGNPESLIRRFHLNNLEEVFLALCNNKQDENMTTLNKLDTLKDHKELNKPLLLQVGSSNKSASSETAMVAGDDEDELLSVSIQRSQHSTEDDLASNRPSKQSEATAISMSSLATTTNAVSDQNIAAEQEANGTFKTLESSSPSKPSVMFADSSIIRDHHVNSREISQSSPTSPIFSNTLQHRKIQDAQQLANRLMMKRNKILDHFARSSALLTKNFIRMWRNLPVMLFTAFIPGLQCCLFFLCLGRNPYDIPVSVYNAEVPPQFSNVFIQSIDNRTIDIQMVNTYKEGYDSVLLGNSKALISIPANFSKAMMEKSVDAIATDDEVIRMSTIDLYLDMSSQFHANSIRAKIYDAYLNMARQLLSENGYNQKLADPPIHIAEPILGNRDPTVTEFMAPGFILSLAFFASIATAALTLVLERKDGLLERSLVSGVNPNEYILSHVITQTVVVILQTFSVLFIAFYIFEIPNVGSVFWISVLIVMQGVCGMSYGVLISAIAKEESFTLAACMGSMFPQFLLSGVVWPVDTMPKPLALFANFFSQAKSLEAVRYMLYRGWDPLHHFDVSLGFIITTSWTIVFLFIATILFNVHKS